MSNYNSLKTTINANVKQNGRQEITGQILNSVLNQMVNTLGAGYQFAGVATTATNPGSPDAKVFYIANGKGTYTNFGGLQVTEDDVVVLYWDSSWHKVSTGIASKAKLSELEDALNGYSEETAIVDVVFENDSYNFLPNILNKDVEYKLSLVNSYGNWIRFGFSKTNSVSSWNDTNVYPIYANNVQETKDEMFVGVDRNEYPYIIYRLSRQEDSFKVYNMIEGISQKVERIDNEMIEIKKSLEPKEVDFSNDGTFGYYDIRNSDATKEPSTSLYTCETSVREGDVIRTNTQQATTTAVGSFLTNGNKARLKILDLATLHEYTITASDIELGVTAIAVVYRTTSQTETFFAKKIAPISLSNLDERVTALEQGGTSRKEFDGKTIILCGDSQLGLAQDVDTRVQNALGGIVYNWGFGGCQMAWRTSDGSSKWDAFCMVGVADALATRNFSNMDAQTELYEDYPYFQTSVNEMKSVNLGDGENVILTIAYGGNDYNNDKPIGEANDNVKTTLKGAMNYAVKTLLTAYPKLTILFVGTPYRVMTYSSKTADGITTDSDNTPNALGKYRVDYNDAVKEQAQVLKTPFFDMYRRSGRNKFNVWSLCPNDGTHPTSNAGKQAEAELYVKILRTF